MLEERHPKYKNPYLEGTNKYNIYRSALIRFIRERTSHHTNRGSNFQTHDDSTSPTNVYLDNGHYNFCELKEEQKKKATIRIELNSVNGRKRMILTSQ